MSFQALRPTSRKLFTPDTGGSSSEQTKHEALYKRKSKIFTCLQALGSFFIFSFSGDISYCTYVNFGIDLRPNHYF